MSDELHLQIAGSPTWAVVRDYHDGSGLLNVYGPFKDEDAAAEAIAALKEAGLDSRFTALPLWSVRSVGADT